MPGLENRVLDESQAGLFGFHVEKPALGQHFYLIAQHGLQLGQFAGIAAGQHQLGKRQ